MFKSSLLLIVLLSSFFAVAKSSDPTKPFGLSSAQEKSEAKKSMVLESIIHGDKLHTAVINGKVLKPGQYIGDYRLVAVNDDSVVLRSETERLKLYIFSNVIVK